jgi:hypothetical protein
MAWYAVFDTSENGNVSLNATVELKGTYDVLITCQLTLFQTAPYSSPSKPDLGPPFGDIIITGYEKGGAWTTGSWQFLQESGVTAVSFQCNCTNAWVKALGLVQTI